MSVVLGLRPDLDSYTERVTLDGVEFDLAFVWNERDSQHYMSIFLADTPVNTDGSRVAIIASLPVLVNAPLLLNVPGRVRPLGELIALDTSGQDLEAGRGELGRRVILTYTPQADLPEVE